MFVMKVVQKIVTNSDSFFKEKLWNLTGVWNENNREIVMKKDRVFESVFMFALFWEMSNRSLVFIHSDFIKKERKGFVTVANNRINYLRSPGKLDYEHPIFFIPISRHYFTYSNNHSIPNSRWHSFDFPVFSITISWSKWITNSR